MGVALPLRRTLWAPLTGLLELLLGHQLLAVTLEHGQEVLLDDVGCHLWGDHLLGQVVQLNVAQTVLLGSVQEGGPVERVQLAPPSVSDRPLLVCYELF